MIIIGMIRYLRLVPHQTYVEGELVISTNHPFSWSTHMTDCGTSYEVMRWYHQKCLKAKRNALAAIQDASCNFNVNCVPVQESLIA